MTAATGRANRRRGAAAEVEAVHLLHDLGWPGACRLRTPGTEADRGDVGGIHAQGRAVVVEVKGCANPVESVRIGVPQLRASMARTGTDLGVVLVRLRGGRWAAVVPVAPTHTREDEALAAIALPLAGFLVRTEGRSPLRDEMTHRAGQKDRDVWLDAGPVAVPRHGVVVCGPRWWARAIRGEDVRDIGPGDAA